MKTINVEGSFRDPSGFLFWKDTVLYRQINKRYQKHYDFFLSSGLYDSMVRKNMLVKHIEEPSSFLGSKDVYKIIRPDLIPFISYPYEWSFSQLKDAALLTLDIQKEALKYGMVLKDASAYNIQFKDGRPIFIDTLSFEIYEEGYPWVAYKQFCQHFISPLALMFYCDVRLNQLFKTFIDGVPLDLASSMLPLRSYFSFSVLLHIHLHAKSQKHYEDKVVDKKTIAKKMTRQSFEGLIYSIESTIKNFKWKAAGTEWVDYYEDDSYTSVGFEDKKRKISKFLDIVKPKTVWDLGSNNGFFSRVASEKGANVISFDIDPACVDNNYSNVRSRGEKSILPLMLDLTNPSSGIGWNNCERFSVKQRGPVDLTMSLALVHHLAISNNMPLDKVASFLSDIGKWHIVEFVPKEDKKVQKLLATREDIFPNYNIGSFEKTFEKYFEMHGKYGISESSRVLFLMKNRLN